MAMVNKAMILWRTNQLEESKAIYEEALAILEKISPNDPFYTYTDYDVLCLTFLRFT